jgi:phosphatidylserine decarboxylase
MNEQPERTHGNRLPGKLSTAALYALPHHALSHLMHRATRVRLRAWKDCQIRWFIKRYGVDMGLAEQPSHEAYADFNAFFTRALRPGARPISGNDVVCPADGTLSQFGAVRDDLLVQAKGSSFSLTRLLGGEPARAAPFQGGHFATVYLSPRDYHRVHMPLAGTLREMVHVPGRLFSVNSVSTSMVRNLFVRNERVVSLFDTDRGPLAIVLVGAIFVGSIEQVWAGQVAPAATSGTTAWRYQADGPTAMTLAKGEEMGRFNMGSTVIVALPPGRLRWCPELAPGRPVTMGTGLADLG